MIDTACGGGGGGGADGGGAAAVAAAVPAMAAAAVVAAVAAAVMHDDDMHRLVHRGQAHVQDGGARVRACPRRPSARTMMITSG